MSQQYLYGRSLEGKTAVITGASAGIGKATALMLAAHGCRVVAVARRADKLKELTSAHPQIQALVLDVVRDGKSLSTKLGAEPVDILINNAGLARGRGTFDQTSFEDWNEMVDTNVKGLLAVSQSVIPQMLKRGSGDIVNIGSIAGLFTYAGGSVYCATKFAVHAISQAWRQDFLGKDIRVMEICPGMVETEFSMVRFRGDQEKARQTYEGMVPLVAEDIADAIVWSLSRPRHVTIQNAVVMPTDQASVGQVHRRASKT